MALQRASSRNAVEISRTKDRCVGREEVGGSDPTTWDSEPSRSVASPFARRKSPALVEPGDIRLILERRALGARENGGPHSSGRDEAYCCPSAWQRGEPEPALRTRRLDLGF